MPSASATDSYSNEGVIDSIVPFFVNDLLSGPNIYEWNYTTTLQVGLNNRSIAYPRGKTSLHLACQEKDSVMLGGCTSHSELWLNSNVIFI